MYIYIYIYRERERERYRYIQISQGSLFRCVCLFCRVPRHATLSCATVRNARRRCACEDLRVHKRARLKPGWRAPSTSRLPRAHARPHQPRSRLPRGRERPRQPVREMWWLLLAFAAAASASSTPDAWAAVAWEELSPACTYIYIYIYIHVCIHIYIYIYTCTHIHTMFIIIVILYRMIMLYYSIL